MVAFPFTIEVGTSVFSRLTKTGTDRRVLLLAASLTVLTEYVDYSMEYTTALVIRREVQ